MTHEIEKRNETGHGSHLHWWSEPGTSGKMAKGKLQAEKARCCAEFYPRFYMKRKSDALKWRTVAANTGSS
jgi:hypothetical protein